jgi:hypothetical protein
VTRRSRAGTVALALVVAVAGCATSGAHRLAERLPAELPDALTLAGWDRFAGQAQMGDAVVVYELYVNPIRPALYEITRYRLTSTARDRRQQTEKVLWNPATGSREPLRAFEWIHKRTWKTLWLGDPGEWRRIEPQTPAYESEMRNAIRVYQLHNERRTY